MITLELKKMEFYDEEIGFFEFPAKTVDFEYSLLAVYKWEAKWKLPFLSTVHESNDPKLIDFYLCMSKDPTLEPEYITYGIAKVLKEYIDSSQTATSFTSQNGNTSPSKAKAYTSEELYALMFMNGIPLEFEERNLNRLLVILKIISVYTNPPKKMSQRETLQQNSSINEQRKKELNTRG